MDGNPHNFMWWRPSRTNEAIAVFSPLVFVRNAQQIHLKPTVDQVTWVSHTSTDMTISLLCPIRLIEGSKKGFLEEVK